MTLDDTFDLLQDVYFHTYCMVSLHLTPTTETEHREKPLGTLI